MGYTAVTGVCNLVVVSGGRGEILNLREKRKEKENKFKLNLFYCQICQIHITIQSL